MKRCCMEQARNFSEVGSPRSWISAKYANANLHHHAATVAEFGQYDPVFPFRVLHTYTSFDRVLAFCLTRVQDRVIHKIIG